MGWSFGFWTAHAVEMTPFTVTGLNRHLAIEKSASGPPFLAAVEFRRAEGNTRCETGNDFDPDDASDDGQIVQVTTFPSA